ncbi:MAG: hypothetical protein ABH824_04530, partial [Nanoarchaeota archaeon]|nr:hypothetical protein [Nanoarchaeota archaeon]
MKKIIILMIMLLTFSLVHAAVPYSTPQVEVTLQSQNPDPVEPGQVLTVKFKVENEGIETSDDVIVKILPKFPFTLYGDVAEKNIGKLRASSTGADAEIIEYKLKVDEQAVEGNNELELKVQIGDGYISYTNNEFLINIQTHDTVLDITSITTDPERIAPGETAEIT